MFISWVIPLYNCQQYIGNCIDSIIGQNLPDEEFEIIVVNDGSTDGGESIVAHIAKTHSNIFLINQSNMGVSEARNSGLHLAKGDFVHFVDADDLLFADSVASLYNDYKEGVFGDIDMITFKQKKIFQNAGCKLLYNKSYSIEKTNLYDFFVKSSFQPSVFTFFFRTSFLVKNSLAFRPQPYAEDLMFLYEIYSNHNANICEVGTTVYGYFQRRDSATHKRTPESSSAFFDCLCSASAYLRENLHGKFPDLTVLSHHLYIQCLALTTLLSTSFSLKEMKEIFMRGRLSGLFPIRAKDTMAQRFLSFLSHSPVAAWLSSFAYRHLYIPLVLKRRDSIAVSQSAE